MAYFENWKAAMIELMGQMLLEMRINNQYMSEMAANIVKGIIPSFFSTTPQTQYIPATNEPAEFRNEQSIFNN